MKMADYDANLPNWWEGGVWILGLRVTRNILAMLIVGGPVLAYLAFEVWGWLGTHY